MDPAVAAFSAAHEALLRMCVALDPANGSYLEYFSTVRIECFDMAERMLELIPCQNPPLDPVALALHKAAHEVVLAFGAYAEDRAALEEDDDALRTAAIQALAVVEAFRREPHTP